MTDIPPLLKAALQLRAETDLSRLFLPAMTTPNRPPLSPAAQAVLDHFLADVEISLEHGIAAALRAATDQVVPPCSTRSDRGTQRMMIRHELLAIAAELESTDQSTKSTHLETDDEQ